MACSVETGSEEFTFEPPVKLADSRWEPGKDMAVSPNGDIFFVQDDRIASDAPISLVINWARLLERRKR